MSSRLLVVLLLAGSSLATAMDIGLSDSRYLVKNEVGQGWPLKIRFLLCPVDDQYNARKCISLSTCEYVIDALEKRIQESVKDEALRDGFLAMLRGSTLKQFRRAPFVASLLRLLEAESEGRDCRISVPIKLARILDHVWSNEVFERPGRPKSSEE